MSTKFEQLLDLLVNEEHEKANELFHSIVVEKSREIYENLIAEEAEEDQEDEDQEEEDESVEEAFGMEDEGQMEEEGDEVGGDATDDFVSDTESPDDAFGDEEGEEGGDETPATKSDVQDLEDALEELKAEFERLMNAEEAEEEENPGVHGDASLTGADDEEDDEEGEEDESEEEFESLYNESRQLTREYREKVASPSMTDGGGVGSGKGDLAGQTGTVNTKSPVSSGSGKPTSGANAKNIAQAGTGEGNNTGTSPNAKGPAGVLKAGGDFVPAGTKNVASSSTAKMQDGAKLSAVSKPAMKKEGEGVGSGRGDKAGQTSMGSTKSIVDHKI
jgi:hypothetical protein